MKLKVLLTVATALAFAPSCGTPDDGNNDTDGMDASGESGEASTDDPSAGTDESGEETTDAESDTDDSGSSTTEEPDPDSDGDGLTDAEEAELGTDPNKKDTDADQYWDSWEVWEGTDPLDKASRIYTGYWPYNPDKEELHQGTWAEAGKKKGDPWPRMELVDQHGELLDFYDLSQYNADENFMGAPIIVDVAAVWCGPCNEVARWLAYNQGQLAAQLNSEFPTMRDRVHSGEWLWVTVLFEDSFGNQSDAGTVKAWATQYNDPWIPVLVDEGKQIAMTYNSDYIPLFFILHPDMKLEYWPPSGDGYETLAAIEEHWPD